LNFTAYLCIVEKIKSKIDGIDVERGIEQKLMRPCYSLISKLKFIILF